MTLSGAQACLKGWKHERLQSETGNGDKTQINQSVKLRNERAHEVIPDQARVVDAVFDHREVIVCARVSAFLFWTDVNTSPKLAQKVR